MAATPLRRRARGRRAGPRRALPLQGSGARLCAGRRPLLPALHRRRGRAPRGPARHDHAGQHEHGPARDAGRRLGRARSGCDGSAPRSAGSCCPIARSASAARSRRRTRRRARSSSTCGSRATRASGSSSARRRSRSIEIVADRLVLGSDRCAIGDDRRGVGACAVGGIGVSRIRQSPQPTVRGRQTADAGPTTARSLRPRSLELRPRAGDAGVPLPARSLLAHRGRVARSTCRRTGPVLLVANHSGALPFDGAMIVTAVDACAGAVVRFLYDRFVETVAPLDAFYRKVGGVDGVARERAGAAADGRAGAALPRGHLRRGEAVQRALPAAPVQPGLRAARHAARRARGPGRRRRRRGDLPARRPRRGPSARRSACPTCRSRRSSRCSDLLGALPLPTKWFIRFGKPIGCRAGERRRPTSVPATRRSRVRRRLQAMVTRLKNRRRSVFFG